MTICSGACWSPARLLEEGIITAEDAVCPLCGQPEADEGHLFWECPKVMESRHPAIQKSNKFVENTADAKATQHADRYIGEAWFSNRKVPLWDIFSIQLMY